MIDDKGGLFPSFDDFVDKFISKDTRSYESISVDELQVWLKLMGGETPGVLTADANRIYDLFGELQLTDPEIAQRGQVFYDIRNTYFPNWYELQNQYYNLPEGAQRKQFKKDNPEYKEYSDWRIAFMRQNPDLTPYLTDSKWLIEDAQRRQRRMTEQFGQIPVATAQELQAAMLPGMPEFIADYGKGEQLPSIIMDELGVLGQRFNLTPEQIINIVQAGR